MLHALLTNRTHCYRSEQGVETGVVAMVNDIVDALSENVVLGVFDELRDILRDILNFRVGVHYKQKPVQGLRGQTETKLDTARKKHTRRNTTRHQPPIKIKTIS